MKYIFYLLGTASILAMSILFALTRIGSTPATIQIQSQGPTVERLQRLSQLVTLKVVVADVLVAEGEGCKGSWLIRGDAMLGIDLARAQIVDRNEAARQATVLLPQPTILHPRVDHTRTKTWQVQRMAWLSWNADEDRLRDNVMQKAQELVAHAAGGVENLGQARAVAESAITSLFDEVGWQVKVTWAPDTAQPAEAGPR